MKISSQLANNFDYCSAENGSLETIVKIKSSIPGARIKEIIPVEKKPEQPQKQS